jgi:cleavage stimulation factor subunit 3
MRPVMAPDTRSWPGLSGTVGTSSAPQKVVTNPLPQIMRVASPPPLNSPHMAHLLPATDSPKRPLEDAENDQPRKFTRAESPLKGAAGRRLDAARRSNMAVGGNTPVAAPFQWPREINFLLSIIPNASTYDATRFRPEAMIDLLQDLTLPLPPQHAAGGFPPFPPPGASQPPAAHINTQLQNIQARYGGGSAWPST